MFIELQHLSYNNEHNKKQATLNKNTRDVDIHSLISSIVHPNPSSIHSFIIQSFTPSKKTTVSFFAVTRKLGFFGCATRFLASVQRRVDPPGPSGGLVYVWRGLLGPKKVKPRKQDQDQGNLLLVLLACVWLCLEPKRLTKSEIPRHWHPQGLVPVVCLSVNCQSVKQWEVSCVVSQGSGFDRPSNFPTSWGSTLGWKIVQSMGNGCIVILIDKITCQEENGFEAPLAVNCE